MSNAAERVHFNESPHGAELRTRRWMDLSVNPEDTSFCMDMSCVHQPHRCCPGLVPFVGAAADNGTWSGRGRRWTPSTNAWVPTVPSGCAARSLRRDGASRNGPRPKQARTETASLDKADYGRSRPDLGDSAVPHSESLLVHSTEPALHPRVRVEDRSCVEDLSSIFSFHFHTHQSWSRGPCRASSSFFFSCRCSCCCCSLALSLVRPSLLAFAEPHTSVAALFLLLCPFLPTTTNTHNRWDWKALAASLLAFLVSLSEGTTTALPGGREQLVWAPTEFNQPTNNNNQSRRA